MPLDEEAESPIDVRKLNLSAEKLYQVENMMMPLQRQAFLAQAQAQMQRNHESLMKARASIQRNEEGMRKMFNDLKRFGSVGDSAGDSVENSVEDSTEDSTEDAPNDSTQETVQETVQETAQETADNSVEKEEERGRLLATCIQLSALRHETHVKSKEALDAYHELEEQARMLDRSVDYINEYIAALEAQSAIQRD